MPDIDHGELAKRLADEGGFSVSSAGNPPRSGVMVSRVGAEQVIPGTAGPDDIRTYARHHARELQRTGAYLGGWLDEGDTYLDVSQRFTDPHQAKHAATANDQLSSYDVDHDSFPATEPSLFPLEPNVDPLHPRQRGMAAIMGEKARRQALARQRGTQLRIPGENWERY